MRIRKKMVFLSFQPSLHSAVLSRGNFSFATQRASQRALPSLEAIRVCAPFRHTPLWVSVLLQLPSLSAGAMVTLGESDLISGESDSWKLPTWMPPSQALM